MQYSIKIDQLAVMNAGLDVDVVDMTIFDFIQHYAHSDKCMKLQTENGTYYWVSHTIIIQQLPILGISTGAGIVKRINKLIDAGLLERHPNCDMMRKTFYKFGPNYYRINFTTDNESLQPTTNVGGSPNESFRTSPNESFRNHYIREHSTIEHSDAADGGLFPSESTTPVIVKQSRRKPKCLFEDTEFADFEKFKAQFTESDFADIDLFYYYNRIKNWSGANAKKKADWILTAKNWMMDDAEKGKLHRLGGGSALSPDAIEYLQNMAD